MCLCTNVHVLDYNEVLNVYIVRPDRDVALDERIWAHDNIRSNNTVTLYDSSLCVCQTYIKSVMHPTRQVACYRYR